MILKSLLFFTFLGRDANVGGFAKRGVRLPRALRRLVLMSSTNFKKLARFRKEVFLYLLISCLDWAGCTIRQTRHGVRGETGLPMVEAFKMLCFAHSKCVKDSAS